MQKTLNKGILEHLADHYELRLIEVDGDSHSCRNLLCSYFVSSSVGTCKRNYCISVYAEIKQRFFIGHVDDECLITCPVNATVIF